jgi:hypothetical protein
MKRYKQLLISLLLASTLTTIGCTDSKSDLSNSACDDLGLSAKNGKIIAGTECSRSGSPVVGVTVLLEDGGVGLCSGTAITSKHVLTAAHCLVDSIGASVLAGGRDFAVIQRISHPAYNDQKIPNQNDAAILVIDGDMKVPTVPLLLSRPIEPSDIMSIYGYGNDTEESNGVLRSGEMRIEGINGQYFIARFQLEGSNICQGDSGGPAVYSYTDSEGAKRQGIIGITSFGQVPCEQSGRSGFQNVQSNSVVDFITGTVPSVAVK